MYAHHLHSLIETARHNEIGLSGMISAKKGHTAFAADAPANILNGVDRIPVPVGQMHDRSPLARVPHFDGLQQRVT